MFKKRIIIVILILLNGQKSYLQERPNIVFFMADDCTYRDLGPYGSENSITPNIDELAREGMKFNKCFQAAPMCSPTRHNLLTGIYPVRSGAYPNHTFVKADTKSIVQYLRPLGYRVALSGKRHVSPKSVFDFEYLGSAKNIDFKKVQGFLKDAKKNKKPFCLFLMSHQPHVPWNKGDQTLFNKDSLKLPPFYVDTKETREGFRDYITEINYMDSQVGKALQLIKEEDLTENTIFIFTSEQGNSFPFAKYTCYDSGLHTAFIAKWPGKIEAGVETEALIDYTDVVPTFIDIAQGKRPDGLDGSSFLKVLQGETQEHKEYSYGVQTTRGIIAGSDHFGIRSVTDGQYVFIMNLSPDEEFQNLATNPEKGRPWWNSWVKASKTDPFAEDMVNSYRRRPKFELYDSKHDPYNIRNLAGKPEYSKVQKKLYEKLIAWMEYCGDEGQKTEMKALSHQVKRHKK